ncbi:hypothetical protein [Phytoactinopolyspora halotolerans]|uniref:Uncharacterized protein n=1 Tax=Phytoactinopolyspora halotolerans TaxID=1981512 RepID=A0A6L9S3D6_9ACTN|nr:hypothetical protein [Phytoactinopolyspora halotolerans]NED99143.1 hypothetical protein [Phytoactinopolyspora halotolerans]
MGGRKRAHDAAAPGNDVSGSGDDGLPRLPALQLGIIGDHPPDPPRPHRPVPGDGSWRRWLVVGMALAVGVAAGVVGTNARHDATESATVDLIGGQTALSRPAIPGSPAEGWQGEFLIFNPGETAVELVDVSVPGWGRIGPTEPVTADAERWTLFRTTLLPDCDAELSTADTDGSTSLAAEIVVRSRGTERTLPVTFAPGQSWLRSAWASVCRPADIGPPELTVATIQMLSRRDGITSVRARLRLATTGGQGTAAISGMWSHVPGFRFAVTGLPATVDESDVTEIELEWEVANCAIVERLNEARLSFHVADQEDPTAARLQTMPVPAAILVALGRLSAQMCGL